jgi:fibronectin-binding autotransporter adhesin
VSATSKLWIGGSAGMTLLDDGAGTINLGNNVDVGVGGTGERDGPTIFVGNNNTANGGNSSGTTTGSTIALGTFDLTFGDARSSQILRIRGADGYRLQLGGLRLAKRADHSNPQIEPTTAPVTIAGPVIQASGKLATDSTNSDTLDLIGTATGNLISGVIQNAADYPSNPSAKPLNIRKSGTGEWIFTGTNTYTGTTAVTAGTLLVNSPGSLDPASTVSVTGTATLGGNGTIGGSVTVAASANLAPGASAGTLSIGGNLDISALAGGAGKLVYELGTIAASDRIAVTGGLVIGSGVLGIGDFDFTNVGGLQEGVYTLITSSGITGTLNGADLSGDIDGTEITLGTSGNNIILTVGTPSGTAYDAWATGNEPFDGDANGDGVKDGLAWLLGAANPSENAVGRLPTVTRSGGGLILNFNCLPIAARGTATLKVAHSTNLVSWTATTDVVPDADDAVPDNDVTFVVDTVSEAPLNSVTATIDSAAADDGKLFGRLEATQP